MENFKDNKSEAPTTEQLVSKLWEIQTGLKQNLLNLQQKLKEFDSKPELFVDIEVFRKESESRANSLEAEVKRLREELKSIKELLGLNIKENTRADC